MRACFLKSMVCALGNGIAIVQTPPASEPDNPNEEEAGDEKSQTEPFPVALEGGRLDPYH
jgi:hypothetical protein